MLAKKRKYFRERFARKRFNVWNRKPRSYWFKNGHAGKKNFRMTRESFMSLLAEVNSFISPNPSSPNYRAISAKKKLAWTLYIFGKILVLFLWGCYQHYISCHYRGMRSNHKENGPKIHSSS